MKIKNRNKKGRMILALLFLTGGFLLARFYVANAGLLDNVSGWLWGGTEESDDGLNNGNETGVGWISANSTNCDTDGNNTDDVCGGGLVTNYGLNIPSSDEKVTGYVWSSNLGWVDFEPQAHCTTSNPPPGIGFYQASSCSPPNGKAEVFRSGDELIGWARIVSIAQASYTGNSGGWQGWISMNQSTSGGSIDYGVEITKMDGTGNDPTYAWSDELGWVDFSRAATGPPRVDLKINGLDSLNLILAEGGSAPEEITLSWSIANAVSCIASCVEGDCNSWNDTPSKSIAGGTENVALVGPNVSYKLECQNASGESGWDVASVLVQCRNTNCSNNLCEGTFFPTLFYNCTEECNDNTECQTEGIDWKEVIP